MGRSIDAAPAGEELIFARCAHVPLALVTVLRQCARPQRAKCETHHMCIAATGLLLRHSRWWAVEDYSYVDAASDVLVVQIRGVRAIHGSLPVPAALGALLKAALRGRTPI